MLLYQITLTTLVLTLTLIGLSDGFLLPDAESSGAQDRSNGRIAEFERNNNEKTADRRESDEIVVNNSTHDVINPINAEIDLKNKKKKQRPTYKNIRAKDLKAEKYKNFEEAPDVVLSETLSNLERAEGYGSKINFTTAASFTSSQKDHLSTQEVHKINEALDEDVKWFVGESTSAAPAIVSEYGYMTTIAPVTEKLEELKHEHLDPIFKVPIVVESPAPTQNPAIFETTVAPIVEEKATTTFLLPISSEVPVITDNFQFELINTTFLPFGQYNEIDLPQAEALVQPVPDVGNQVDKDEVDQAQEEAQIQPQIQQIFEAPNHKNFEIQKSIEKHVQHLPYQVEVQNVQPHPAEIRLPLDIPEQVNPTQQYMNFEHEIPTPKPFQIPLPLAQTFYLPLEIQKPFPIYPQNYANKPYVVQQVPIHLPIKQVIQPSELHQYKIPVDFPKFRMMEKPHQMSHHYQLPVKQHLIYNYRDPISYAPKPNYHVKNTCAELKQMGIYKSYCSMNLNNYIGLVPPKHSSFHFREQYGGKQRKARQNFESNIRLEYGFMPPLIPSLQIDELGNPIEPHT